MREETGEPRGGESPPVEIPCATEEQVRTLAWDLCGIIRSGEGLAAASNALARMALEPARRPPGYELRNIHTVAQLIARCALARQESRGAHFRTDFPAPRPEFAKHSFVSKGNEIIFR